MTRQLSSREQYLLRQQRQQHPAEAEDQLHFRPGQVVTLGDDKTWYFVLPDGGAEEPSVFVTDNLGATKSVTLKAIQEARGL